MCYSPATLVTWRTIMKKFAYVFCLSAILAGNVQASGFDFSQSGLAGVYYGVMQTRRQNNYDNLPNRLVYRQDGRFEGAYKFADETRLGAHADYTLAFRQHDKDYNGGDWRFYPYALVENPNYGKFTIGYSYNAAQQLHQGAQDISWIGIQDSNLTNFLTDVNWVNGLKKTKFASPKSTTIIDDGRAVKFVYFTPMIGNTKFGFSYTPENASRRGMISRYADYEETEDGYTAAMQNKWSLGLGDIYTSAAYGEFNGTDKEWAVGARWVVNNFNVSSSYKKSYIDGNKNKITVVSNNPYLPDLFDNYREGQSWDFSIGYKFFDRLKVNFAYLHTDAKNTRNRDDLYVQANSFEVNKYVELFLINGYINSKGTERLSKNNNRGYAIISGVALKY